MAMMADFLLFHKRATDVSPVVKHGLESATSLERGGLCRVENPDQYFVLERDIPASLVEPWETSNWQPCFEVSN